MVFHLLNLEHIHYLKYEHLTADKVNIPGSLLKYIMNKGHTREEAIIIIKFSRSFALIPQQEKCVNKLH